MDDGQQTPGLEASAHTTGRKSARSQRIEIITRGERRRSWTLEQKREIVTESLGSELTPTEVARKHAISSGQLYTWRRQLLSMTGTAIERAVPRFAAVDLAPSSPGASEPAPIGETMAAERTRGMITSEHVLQPVRGEHISQLVGFGPVLGQCRQFCYPH